MTDHYFEAPSSLKEYHADQYDAWLNYNCLCDSEEECDCISFEEWLNTDSYDGGDVI